MTSEEIKSLIWQAREAWISGDADTFAALFDEAGEFIVPGDRWVGQQAIRKVVAEFSESHSAVKIEIRQILVDGDRAAVEWVWEDTETATGRSNRAEDAIAVDFERGKICRWREYIDASSK